MPGANSYTSVHPLYRKLAVLTEGTTDIYRNKTAIGLLRFRGEDVVCVLDTQHAGQSLRDLTGIDRDIPVVGTVEEVHRLGAQWLVIGVATPGGYLPLSLRPLVYESLRRRIGLISGLHDSVNGDPNLVSLAARYAVELVNLRATPDERVVATALARGTKAKRLLVVGTDANIGKTHLGLLLEGYLNRNAKGRHLPARFVPTGQDAILIKGRGVSVDRMIADFAAGMVERLVLEEDRHGAEWLVIEGQNGILSPGYSGTSLSVVHGSCPDAMILVHNPQRTEFRHTDVPMRPLMEHVRLYEALASAVHPARVLAISLNTMGMSAEDAEKACAVAREESGLPVVDLKDGEDAGLEVLAKLLADLPTPERKLAKTTKPRRVAAIGAGGETIRVTRRKKA
jgi:uncharacterized NAD-dependent epimerase/dehydratase family protein